MLTNFQRHRHQRITEGPLPEDGQPWTLELLFLALFVVLLCGSCVGIAREADNAQARRIAKATQAVTPPTHIERTREALPDSLAGAYERGLSDAMQSLKGTPDGIQLAQACLAAGMEVRK